jgi:DNA-binding NtrC family response regulator
MASQGQVESNGKEAQVPSQDGAANDPPRRVLVVEDHDDTRNSFQQLLELSLGLEVDLAADGEEALERLSERPYSIVITDLRMPRLDGMGLIEEIQQRRLPVTIIVTTGHG